MKKTTGTLMLLLTAFIWGTAFVAQSSASENIGSFTFNAARSFIAFFFLLTVIGIRACVFKKRTDMQKAPVSFKKTVIAGTLCGIALCTAANFQQFGIAAYPDGVAASGRAGFLTATYVVMVALCARFFGKKLHPIVWVATAGCIAGMYMLCMSGGLSGLYLGDLLLFICAICYTCHILIIDRFTYIDSIKMSCVQFLVCGIISAIGMLIFEQPDVQSLSSAGFEIFYAGVMSSGVAYTLQMAGQRYAEPAVASIVMSLESVFAALAGWVLLNEHLNTTELMGCGLVFAAVILAQVPEFLKKKECC
jgi:drug/metabolite transporter (DMT)-like permease